MSLEKHAYIIKDLRQMETAIQSVKFIAVTVGLVAKKSTDGGGYSLRELRTIVRVKLGKKNVEVLQTYLN